MRTRDMSYSDYGINNGEEDLLMQSARQFENKPLLYVAATKANMWLADDVIYSIVTGLSYDKICFIRDLPCKKIDFYGYRRKTLALFRDLLNGT